MGFNILEFELESTKTRRLEPSSSIKPTCHKIDASIFTLWLTFQTDCYFGPNQIASSYINIQEMESPLRLH